MRRARALAHSNIALIKYWGKRDTTYNLPAAGSISMTLGGLDTITSVAFDDSLPRDEVWMGGQRLDEGSKRYKITAFLDLVRELADLKSPAIVHTHNSFPTAAGLASSASGFAALALAATEAAGLSLTDAQRSALARRGSGSASRSLFGGFVEWFVGQRDDGEDSYAAPLAAPDHWPLTCLIALCAAGEKTLGSTAAMNATAQTSPYYQSWLDDVPRSLDVARDAILRRDLDALAAVAEASCLRMHACALAADPGILYWRGVTVEVIHRVRAARQTQGLAAFFTIDAGPHVKVFCQPQDAARVEALLLDVPGVHGVLKAEVGGPARLLDAQE